MTLYIYRVSTYMYMYKNILIYITVYIVSGI